MEIRAAAGLVDGALIGPIRVGVGAGRITGVVVGAEADAGGPPDVDLGEATLTPGLLDLQINGCFGTDFAGAQPEDWSPILSRLASHGVTGIEPTIITAPLENLPAAFAGVDAAEQAHRDQPVCRILGVHLEGPFISPRRSGMHRTDWMIDPTPEALDALLEPEATRRILTTVTLAPEREHALAAISRLTGAGYIVAVGHSDATADVVRAAGDAGARMTTHIFNAQRPLTHRDPGVPGGVLSDDRFFIGTIIDGLHVDPRVVGIVAESAPGRMVGVTDAIATAGLPPHTPLHFGGYTVANDENGLGRREDGTISGAGILLDEGVRRMVAAGMDAAVILAACTEVPARSLGRTDIGHLVVGSHADLVAWDADLQPRRVWVGGQEIAAGNASSGTVVTG
ncbi:MAG: N-acetylglucosamine-6-phosphate deacetylase [Propioniciclava sp.]